MKFASEAVVERNSTPCAVQVPEVIVTWQVTAVPAEDALLSQADPASNEEVVPERLASRRFPVLEVGTPSFPGEDVTMTIVLLASCVVMVIAGCVEVPVVLLICPMAETPLYSSTCVSDTVVPDQRTVITEVAGQLWQIQI